MTAALQRTALAAQLSEAGLGYKNPFWLSSARMQLLLDTASLGSRVDTAIAFYDGQRTVLGHAVQRAIEHEAAAIQLLQDDDVLKVIFPVPEALLLQTQDKSTDMNEANFSSPEALAAQRELRRFVEMQGADADARVRLEWLLTTLLPLAIRLFRPLVAQLPPKPKRTNKRKRAAAEPPALRPPPPCAFGCATRYARLALAAVLYLRNAGDDRASYAEAVALAKLLVETTPCLTRSQLARGLVWHARLSASGGGGGDLPQEVTRLRATNKPEPIHSKRKKKQKTKTSTAPQHPQQVVVVEEAEKKETEAEAKQQQQHQQPLAEASPSDDDVEILAVTPPPPRGGGRVAPRGGASPATRLALADYLVRYHLRAPQFPRVPSAPPFDCASLAELVAQTDRAIATPRPAGHAAGATYLQLLDELRRTAPPPLAPATLRVARSALVHQSTPGVFTWTANSCFIHAALLPLLYWNVGFVRRFSRLPQQTPAALAAAPGDIDNADQVLVAIGSETQKVLDDASLEVRSGFGGRNLSHLRKLWSVLRQYMSTEGAAPTLAEVERAPCVIGQRDPMDLFSEFDKAFPFHHAESTSVWLHVTVRLEQHAQLFERINSQRAAAALRTLLQLTDRVLHDDPRAVTRVRCTLQTDNVLHTNDLYLHEYASSRDAPVDLGPFLTNRIALREPFVTLQTLFDAQTMWVEIARGRSSAAGDDQRRVMRHGATHGNWLRLPLTLVPLKRPEDPLELIAVLVLRGDHYITYLKDKQSAGSWWWVVDDATGKATRILTEAVLQPEQAKNARLAEDLLQHATHALYTRRSNLV